MNMSKPAVSVGPRHKASRTELRGEEPEPSRLVVRCHQAKRRESRSLPPRCVRDGSTSPVRSLGFSEIGARGSLMGLNASLVVGGGAELADVGCDGSKGAGLSGGGGVQCLVRAVIMWAHSESAAAPMARRAVAILGTNPKSQSSILFPALITVVRSSAMRKWRTSCFAEFVLVLARTSWRSLGSTSGSSSWISWLVVVR